MIAEACLAGAGIGAAFTAWTMCRHARMLLVRACEISIALPHSPTASIIDALITVRERIVRDLGCSTDGDVARLIDEEILKLRDEQQAGEVDS